MKKFVLLSAFVGAMMFAASNASAVMGLLTLSGTGQFQSTDKQDFPIIQKQTLAQKDLLFILSQATGDESITNKPTKIFFDPDAFNVEASTWATNNNNGSSAIYGIFYYSNAIAGLTRLDGTNIFGDYYSYMEFDFYNSINGELQDIEGFWNPSAMEYTTATTESHNQSSWTQVGNAILYVHSDPSEFNLLGNSGLDDPSAFYLANNWFDFFQEYAVVIHGSITYKIVFNQNDTVTESFTLKGSGDINYSDNPGTFNGTATFTGKGPNEF